MPWLGMDEIGVPSSVDDICVSGSGGEGRSVEGEVALRPDIAEAIRSQKIIRPEGPWVLTAIRERTEPTRTATFYPGDEPRMGEWIQRFNLDHHHIYFMVNTPMRDLDKKASKEDVRDMIALHVDIDPRKPPADATDAKKAEHYEREREAAGAKLRDFKPEPSIVIDSGGGMQAIWLLKKPGHFIDGNVPAAEEAERYNRHLEIVFAADSCHNVDRVLRLPGTINWKRKPGREPRLATVIEHHDDDDHVYTLHDFTAAPPRNVAPTAGQATVQLEGVPPPLASLDELPAAVTPRTRMLIVQGCDPDDEQRYSSRSEVTFAVCCEMVRAGCTDEQIGAVLLYPDWGISAHTLAQKGSVRYAARQIERARAEVEEPMLARLNADHAVIEMYGGACRVVSWKTSEVDPGREEMVVQSFADFKNRYLNVRVQTGTEDGKPKYSPAGEWWLKHPLRRQYRSVVFRPNEEVDDRLEYNLWRGLAVQPRAGEWPLLRKLIEDVLAAGDRAGAEYILRWAAYAVQRPERPAEVALVLRGGKGTGKSTFGRLMSRIFGQHGTTIASSHTMTSNFNKPLHDCCLLFADEALARGEAKAEGIIKSLITEPNIMIEPKGVDAFPSRNRLKVIIASNDEWVVSASADERRFAVFNVSPDKAFPPGSPATDERVAWWVKLNNEIDNGGLEAFLHDLLAMDLGNWHPRLDVPQSSALREQKGRTLTPMQEWLLDVIEVGMIPGQAPHGEESNIRSSNERDRRDGRPGPQDTTKQDRRDGCAGLYDLMRQSSPALRNVSDARLGAFLREWGFENYKHQQKGDYWRGWIFPPLADLRRRWCKVFGAWPFDEPKDGSDARWANVASY